MGVKHPEGHDGALVLRALELVPDELADMLAQVCAVNGEVILGTVELAAIIDFLHGGRGQAGSRGAVLLR